MERYRTEPEYRARKIARARAGHALKRGDIHWAPCRCGSNESEMHHEDYGKPLEVQWLCRPCHVLEHYGPADDTSDAIAGLLERFDRRRELARSAHPAANVGAPRGRVA